MKDISPFAFHRNFLNPSLTSLSHLARYDFQGVQPAISQRLWPPWSAACDCWHASSLQAALRFTLTTRLTSCPPVPVVPSPACTSEKRASGAQSPRHMLLPLAQPGFLNGPCCYWAASSRWFRFPLD